MAKITDPDLLTSRFSTDADGGENVVYDVSAKTILLVAGGSLSAVDGVTLQALYSKYIEDFKNLAGLNEIEPAFEPVDRGKGFDLIWGWSFANQATIDMIRDGAYSVRATPGGNPTEKWACFVTLGNFADNASQTAYFEQGAGLGTVDANQPGPVNQLVQIWSDPNADGRAADGFDRTADFRIYLRPAPGAGPEGYTFADYDLLAENPPATGVLDYDVYAMPLSNSVDDNIGVLDTGIDANADGTADVAPYSGMSITWYTVNQSRALAGGSFNFNIIVDANGGTAQQVYEFVQWMLRKGANINSGNGAGGTDATARIGDVTAALMAYAGNILQTSTGVFIDNLAAASKAVVQFRDTGGTIRVFPSLAPITITFSQTLQNAPGAWFRLFFTNDDAGDNLGNDYGTANAITVQDDTPADIAGNITGPQASYSYEFDTNTQRGAGSAGAPVPLTCVAGALGGAQPVVAQVTMADAGGITIAMVAAQDRAYSNAV